MQSSRNRVFQLCRSASNWQLIKSIARSESSMIRFSTTTHCQQTDPVTKELTQKNRILKETPAISQTAELEDSMHPQPTTTAITKEPINKSKQLEKEERLQQQLIRDEANKRFKKHVDSLPELRFPGYYKIDCVNTIEDTNKHILDLANGSQTKFFGLDFEWRPTFVKGQPENKISLVQICSEDRILLIQLSSMRKFPVELRNFLENRELYKSGVNIRADGHKIYRDFGIFTNGLVELAEVAESTQSPKLKIIHQRSLRALTALFLEKRMAKGNVRVSDWSRKKLSANQIKYAALDAYASYQLMVSLDMIRDKNKLIDTIHLADEASSVVKTSEKRVIKNQKQQTKRPQPASRLLNNCFSNKNFPTSTTVVIKKKPSTIEPPLEV
ncbi:ribonuclease H-like domain-containing protein [Cokeromyces recurvatus]|uniref:ribonuclease H-like domain-containing protein n=1 Tax=Cokeromyces recurvatus TaxID=90255 RepID=UPI002220207F|nr:ribonuclease H-like domain-containing protein [Cokeromyces recurvatus]KAI7906080.1 ribonuclease H-like domain-containing protein [Cokeromyces recurvatus]